MSTEYSPLDPAVLHPCLRALLSNLEAMLAVPEAELCAWAEPQIHQLIAEYCVTQQPPEDMRLWLRERFLADQRERT